MKRLEVSWKRFVLEAVTIVASILLAFGIDAWWERRGSEEDLRALLAAVRSEFEANREAIAFQLRVERTIVSSIDALSAELEMHPGQTISVADTLLSAAAFWAPSLNPATAAVESLVASGRIEQIEDVELRTALGGWASLLDDAIEEQLGAMSVVAEGLWTPLLDRMDYTGPVDRTLDYFYGPGLTGGAQRALGTIEVRAERRLRNRLQLNRYWVQAAIAELEGVQRQVDRVLELIDRTLGT